MIAIASEQVALREQSVWKHPVCATVTYLSVATAGDIPTVVFDSAIDADSGINGVRSDSGGVGGGGSRSNIRSSKEERKFKKGVADTVSSWSTDHGSLSSGRHKAGPTQACISYPQAAKHLAFRGKYLHGCPLELARGSYSQGHEEAARISGRLTLLVNIWRSRPAGIERLPADVAARLSAAPTATRFLRQNLDAEQLRVVVSASRRRGGVGPAVSLSGHVEGMTRPLPLRAVAAAQEESSCLCVFV